MREQIPKLRESIKEASMRDLKDFLENIRKYSSKMGEIAMRHAAGKILKSNGIKFRSASIPNVEPPVCLLSTFQSKLRIFHDLIRV